MNKLILTTLGIFITALVFSQAYVADTIKIDYGNITPSKEFNLSVSDLREEQSHLISVYEKKKWLFFPVDQLVNFKKPLAIEMQNHFGSSEAPIHHLKVHNFYYKQYESMFKRSFKLSASIELYDVQKSDTSLLGVFYYQKYNSQNAKDSIPIGYLTAIDSFNIQFKNDLSAIIKKQDLDSDNNYHFRRGYPAAKKNLYTHTDLFYGLGFWGFDLELYFSSPEADKKFKRNSKMIRYMHFDNRQSITIARKVNYLNIRLSDRWLFQNKHAFLLGFNRWDDIDEKKRTFEEIFLFQLTASQKIVSNNLDKSGFTYGVGLFEDISYAIYNYPFINIGVLATFGYKF